jgi:hypothetical protein
MELYIIVAGVEYCINDGVICDMKVQEGIGLPPLHRIAERGPQQHGDTDQGFRLDPRIINFLFAIGPPDMLSKRDQIMGLFKPRDAAVSLKWIRDDLAVRQIDGHYVAQLGLETTSAARYYLNLPAQFKADDPAFYDPTLVAILFAIAGGSDDMDVPLAIPWPIGASVLDMTQAIAYVGTWQTYPVITVTGPIDDCVITNLSTGEKLDWTGTAIAAGEQRIVDLRYGRKTVIDEAGADAIAELTTDSDLATWHLAAAPDALGGINSVQVTGTNVTAATTVVLQYLTRYISL